MKFSSFMRCSCCVSLYATKLRGGAGKRTPWGSWSPRPPCTPRVGCVLGARTSHELLRMIVRLDRSEGHLIINRKTDPGWISYSRMGAFFPIISVNITSPEVIVFRWISACLSCCSFSYQVSAFNYIYLWIVDTIPVPTWCIVRFGSILWILLLLWVLRYSAIMVS